MKKILLIFLSFLTVISTASCKENGSKKYEASFLLLFDTVTKIVGYADSEEEFKAFATFIHDDLEDYHELYDKYNDYEGINNIKTINDNAGISPVKVDQRIIDLLLFSKDAYELSNGKMDITFGPVLEIWHDYRTEGVDDPENAKVPPMEMLREAAKHTDINKLIIDVENSTVFLPDDNMSLDVGAVAKGYATEQVVQHAIKAGYNDFLLSVGGNTRAVGGKGKKEAPWNIGIQNPDKESEKSNLFIMSLSDLSLVSSGDYERYYTVDGVRYHHIIDPVTLMPSAYFTAVSIICEDSGMADALSTTLFNLPFEEGKELVDRLENAEAMWVFKDGSIQYTDGFEDMIKD